MGITEKWVRWHPLPLIKGRYEISNVKDASTKFQIELLSENDTQKIILVFEKGIEAYRVVDETYRIKLFGELSASYSDSFYAQWSFFKVINSQYVHSLLSPKSSFGGVSLLHFSIFTSNPIIDIIATYEPKIEIIT